MKNTTTMMESTTRHAFLPAGVSSWLVCLAFLMLAGCATKPASAPEPAHHGWTQDEVSDSYVFGYPLVVMTSARDAALAGGSPGTVVNTLRRAKAPPAANGDALPPRPDIDMLDSTAWLDVAAEPVLVALPATRGEYLDARVLDMWTNVVWSTGQADKARAGGGKPRILAFVAPGWDGQLPSGVERVDAPSTSLWLSVRTPAAWPAELAVARRLQGAVRLAPLSAFGAGEQPKRGKGAKLAARGAADAYDDTPSFAATPAVQAAAVAKLDADGFFTRLAAALRDNAPMPPDSHALDILADLGVKPGEPVNMPKDAADAIAGGLADAHTRIAATPVNALSANGWSWLGDGAGHYADDYTLRAYAAYTHPGSGTKDDDVVATSSSDADGAALDGENRYVLHFSAKSLPPARGFWTLTAYQADGALVEGRLPHRSITSRDRLRRNRDGSVDVYLQTASPGRARQANWVPLPKGPFELVMRLDGPQPSATDGNWQPPAPVRK